MKKIAMIAALFTSSLAFIAPGAAQAGCLKGAAAGAVGGHVLGHHGLIGAAAGCAIGHHRHKVKQQQQQAAKTTTQTTAHR